MNTLKVNYFYIDKEPENICTNYMAQGANGDFK